MKGILNTLSNTAKDEETTTFKGISQLDVLRINIYYDDLESIKKNNVTFETAFNKFFKTPKVRLEIITKLRKHLNNLEKKIKEENK